MVREAVEAGADIIMLDNMSHDTMKEALDIIDGRAEVEISGNITKENLESYQDFLLIMYQAEHLHIQHRLWIYH